MLLIVAYLARNFYTGIMLESNIVKLLPQSEQQPLIQNAINTISNNVGQKTVFLIANTDKDEALNSAQTFNNELIKSKLFTHIAYTINSQSLKSIYQLYSPYKYMLLSKQHRNLLTEKSYDLFSQQALYRLYSPSSPLNSGQLENDPFFTLVDYLQKQNTLSNRFTLDSNHLITQYKNKYYVLISADINSNIYSINTQNQFNSFYKKANSLIKENNQNTQVLSMGAIHYAVEGSESAKYEISIIGTGSLIGIIGLILFVFRSPTPLVLSLISIASGIIVGLSSSLFIFGEVHLFTLVFGASLIGVSIDYSFHYFSERLSGIDNDLAIKHILPGISIGMFSSVLAYLALAVSPFPGLQQISLFSMSGLFAAYCSVVLLYPRIKFTNYSSASTLIIAINKTVLTWWNRLDIITLKLFVIFSLIVLSTIVFYKMEVDDDIRSLRNQSSHVEDEAKIVKDIIKINGENQFYLVQGESADAVLQKEEELIELLDTLISEGALNAYQATALFSPSKKRQLENFSLLKTAIQVENSSLQNHMRAIGLANVKINSYLEQFQSLPKKTFDVFAWLSTEQSTNTSFHWLGKSEIDNTYLSIISLYGIHDINAVKSMSLPDNVMFIDYVDDISNILKQYREQSSLLIIFAYILIFSLLCFRYGWYKAIFVFAPPLLAALSALGIALSIGIKINYFNSLAVILILGIGIDYSLFYAEQKSRAEYTMLAVLLSAITTILAFGLLALSNTPALHSFGVIVLCGISVAFILSPMASLNINKKITD